MIQGFWKGALRWVASFTGWMTRRGRGSSRICLGAARAARRRALRAVPRPPKPSSIMAQVAGSGTTPPEPAPPEPSEPEPYFRYSSD